MRHPLGQNRGVKLGSRSEGPPWYRVLIPATDAARLGPGGLMDNFEKAYRAAGVLHGVEVYEN